MSRKLLEIFSAAVAGSIIHVDGIHRLILGRYHSRWHLNLLLQSFPSVSRILWIDLISDYKHLALRGKAAGVDQHIFVERVRSITVIPDRGISYLRS